MRNPAVEKAVRRRYVLLVEFRPTPASTLAGWAQPGAFAPGSRLVSALPTEYPNQAFERPATGTWARLTIINSTNEQITLGRETGRRFRALNVLVIQVFGEVDQGTGDQAAL